MEISSATNGVGGAGKQLSAESLPLFQEGVYLILSRWSALQLAVENEWGGRGSRQLADQLFSDIVSWFTQSKEPLYIDDLENVLDEGMISLNTMIEDGSVEEVAEKLMILHEECLEGDFSSIEKMRQAGPVSGVHQHIRQVVDDDGGDDDDDEDDDSMGDDGLNMIVDAPRLQPKSKLVNTSVNEPSSKEVQTEEGWQVVSSRRNKGKRMELH